MKEPRFIELINLYVDRQISPAETAELEAEIQTSPRHRKIYQQYCHMHCATKLVYETFRANAEQPVVEPSRSGNGVASFEYSRHPDQTESLALFRNKRSRAPRNFAVVLARNGSFSPTKGDAIVLTEIIQPKASAVAVSPASVPQVAAVSEKDRQTALEAQQYAAQLSLKRQEEMRVFALAQQRIVTQPITLFADSGFDDKLVLTAGNQKHSNKTENRR